jgi:hypothetical protein
VKSLAAMFERKTTVRLDQDKGKFLTNKAQEASSAIVNPYAKQETKKAIAVPE